MNLLIDSVGKQYPQNLWGLQNISLHLRPGVLGLLGPNGAGKSTLMRILATVTRPTRGRVLWNDLDILSSPDPLRMVLGYLPQDFGIYPHLTAFEFLEYLAAVKGLEASSARRRIDELLSVVNLSDIRNRPLGGFSGGMRQRVGIAQALLNDPQLLIVDEPTAGLDQSACVSAISFPNFPASASSFSPPTSSPTLKPWPPTLPSWLMANFSLTILRNHYSPQSQEKSGKSLSPAPPCLLSNSNTSSAARLTATMACMFASYPVRLPCHKHNRLSPPWKTLPRFHQHSANRSRRSRLVNVPRVLLASARADFLERIRRYSFLFTLGLALYFGYLAAVGRIMLRLGETRGIYNSAWVGALLTIVGSTFISFAGFYFVKNTIQRDRETRVGEILASTPLSRTLYIFAKVLSNFAVLSLMIALLALSAIAMQFVRGEDTHIQFWNLLSPFLFLAIPVMAVVAAVAVLFETIPFLRGGLGNVAYFFLWIIALSISFVPRFPASDLTGLGLVKESTMAAAHLSEKTGFSFSLDAGQFQAASATFRWDGISWTSGILLARLFWLGVALAIALLAASLFDRFDPARGYRSSAASAPSAATAPLLASSTSPAIPVRALTPLSASPARSRFLTILSAEIRLLLKGQRWWWYLVALGFIIASAAVPDPSGRGIVLGCAWIWPILLWSSMGIREIQHQTHQLLFSSPHPVSRQLPAVWLAGVLVALLTGSGFALRLLIGANWRGLFAWLVGALFIPTAALALGVWSGSAKPFEILYTLLWYLGPMHAFPALDYAGSSPITSATRFPLLYLALTAAFALAALLGRKRQLLA